MGAIASDSAQVVSPIKSIQRGVFTFPFTSTVSSTQRTRTATIVSVDVTKTVVNLLSTLCGR